MVHHDDRRDIIAKSLVRRSWENDMESDLRSARGAVFGSLGFVAIAMAVLVISGQPVRSNRAIGTPEVASEGASPIASPIAAGSPVQVDIRKLTFRPFRVSISEGDGVVWINYDGVPHTVTAKGEFDSGRIDQSGRFEQKFEQSGEFWYECLYHKDMVAVVEVVESEQ